MSRFVLFLLGRKGYQVLNKAIRGGFSGQISQVVVGRDSQILEDFSDHTVSLCRSYKIAHCTREEFSSASAVVGNKIALAAGWRWLIMEPFRQVIVFHDSLLPKYRGFNPLVTALLRKDDEIGVTAIIANQEFDRGDIITKKSVAVTYPITIAQAIEFVSDLYFELAEEIFSVFQDTGQLKGTPQDETLASYSVWRDEEDYRIDWSWSANDIAHAINCLSFPYKGASTICGDRLIRIFDAEVDSDVDIANRCPGKVLFFSKNRPVVICGTGLLRIRHATYEDGNDALPLPKLRMRLK